MPNVVHFEGISLSDPYIQTKKIRLALAGYDVLLLTEFNQGGYQSALEDFAVTDGRTSYGQLRLNQGQFLPPLWWEISCLVNEAQKNLFQVLILTHSYTGTPISLLDEFSKYTYIPTYSQVPTWLPGYPVTGTLGYDEGYTGWNVKVDVDRDYAADQGGGLYLLQFRAVQRL